MRKSAEIAHPGPQYFEDLHARVLAALDRLKPSILEMSAFIHSHPELVKGKGEREFPGFPMAILVRNKRKYWPNGVWGDPTKASAEKGARLEELVVQKIVELVQKMEIFRD